ncbi:MAG: VanW family protein [Rubrobacter sp.]|nr:VanW family protein [Rubrobacter sp.]
MSSGPVIVLCAGIALVVALFSVVNQLSGSGEIQRGVEAGGVSLGGMTPEQAREALEVRASGTLEEIRFTGPEEEFTVPSEELGVAFDVDATVERAYAVGREDNVFEDFGDRMEATFGTVEVEPQVGYDPEVAQERVGEIADDLESSAQEGSVNVSGAEVQVGEASEGYGVDLDATLRNVDTAITEMTGEAEIVGEVLEPEVSTQEAREAGERAEGALSGPLVLYHNEDEWRVPVPQVAGALEVEQEEGELRVGIDRDALNDSLSEVYGALRQSAVDARFEIENEEVLVTEAEEGTVVDRSALLGEIEDDLFDGRQEYQVPLTTIEPEITTERAERLRPTELLGEYRTNFINTGDDAPERVENLEIASEALDGSVVAPNEVFSVNEVLSPLTYEETKVFIDGKVEEEEGGGLCQVSSTLYMAANYAGMEIMERHRHFALLNYIRPGLDATVWFGRDGTQELDMKFRNASESYLLLRNYVADDGYVYAEVWGEPTGLDVTMRSEEEETDSESSTWTTYKTVEENGETIFDGEIHTDTYEALEDEDGEIVSPEEIEPAPVNP